MVELKEAVATATAFVRDHYTEKEINHLRLEEAELIEDGRFWQIVLGWVESARTQISPSLFGTLGAARPEVLPLPRVYKRFLIDESGKVKSMKIYEP